MTPLETAAYNFLLARSDRYGCSPTGDLVDFARERELKIVEEIERINNNYQSFRDIVVKTRQYIARVRKGERE